MTQPPLAGTDNRLKQLDGLRGLAIVGVLLNHFLPFTWTVWCGWTGVNLFFVLSGFLITRILLLQRDLAAGGHSSLFRSIFIFYIRRSIRIFPLYYTVIITMILFDFGNSRRVATPLATYTYNHHLLEGGKPHLWSLSVEEQFYLGWPALVLFMPARFLLPAMVAVFACGPAWRLGCFFQGTSRIPMYFHTLSCLDCLTAGSFLALFEKRGPESFARALRGSAAAGVPLMAIWALLCTFPTALEWNRVGVQWLIGNTAMALFFAYVVGKASGGLKGWIGRLLGFKPLIYMGTISYGIYVIHMFMPDVWDAFVAIRFPGWQLLKPPVMTLLAILAGTVSWHAFENPIQSLKHFFPYKAGNRTVDPLAPSSKIGAAA